MPEPGPHDGDPLPASVERFVERFAAGDAAGAAACFSADGRYAYPGDPGEERGARIVGAGGELEATIGADPALGLPLELRACAVAGADCLLEGRIVSGDGVQSFGACIELDAEGRIARHLGFRCDLVAEVAEAAAADAAPGDAEAKVDAYFHELEAGRFEAAVGHFTPECLYSHPPYAPGLERAEFRGRAELLAGFERRGKLSKRHFTVAAAQRGPHLLLEGLVWLEGTADGRDASFMSSATLAPDGRIARYVAFVCEPAVPRRGGE